MNGVDQMNQMKAAGFSDDEVSTFRDQTMQQMTSAGFNNDETNAYFGINSNPNVAPATAAIQGNVDAHVAANVTPDGQKKPLSFGEALDAGFGHSVTGLIASGKLPVELTGNEPWYVRQAANVAQLYGDAPAMIAGFVAGSGPGAAVGGALGSVVGPEGTALGAGVGAVAGAGAGTFAVPTWIRETLMDAYKSGDFKSFSDYWDRIGPILLHTARDATVGAMVGPAGGAARGALAKAGAAPLAQAAGATAAEIATVASAGKMLSGQVPDLDDFTNAATLILGAKAIGAGAGLAKSIAGKMQAAYAQRGVTPEQMVREAPSTPSVAQDLASATNDIPTAYGGDRTEPTMTPAENAADVEANAPEPETPPVEPPAPEPGSADEARAAVLDKIKDPLEAAPGAPFNSRSFYTKVIDQRDPIKQMEVAAGAGDAPAYNSAFKRMSLLPGLDSTFERWMKFGPVMPDGVDATGPGLGEILKPHAGDLDGLTAYWAAKQAIEMDAKGLKAAIPIDAAKTLVDADAPKYDAAAVALTKFANNNVEYLRGSGVLSDESADTILAKWNSYAPFNRVIDAEGSGFGVGNTIRNPIKSRKGSDLDIINPVATLIQNTRTTLAIGQKNAAVKSFYDLAKTSAEKEPTALTLARESNTYAGARTSQEGTPQPKGTPVEKLFSNFANQPKDMTPEFRAKMMERANTDRYMSTDRETHEEPLGDNTVRVESDVKGNVRAQVLDSDGTLLAAARIEKGKIDSIASTGGGLGRDLLDYIDRKGIANVDQVPDRSPGFVAIQKAVIAGRNTRAAEIPANPFFEEVPASLRPITISADEMQSYLEKQGIEGTPDDLLTTFRAMRTPLAKDEVGFFDDGQWKVLKVDPEIAAAFNETAAPARNLLMSMARGVASMFRAGLVSPDFIVRHLIRNQAATGTIAERPVMPFLTIFKGMADVLGKTEAYQDYLSSGAGMQADFVEDSPIDVMHKLVGESPETNFPAKVWNVVKTPFELAHAVQAFLEKSTRVGAFSTYMDGMDRTPENLMDAGAAARNVAPDPARIGSATATWNAITPLFNIELQHTDQMVTALRTNPLGTMTRILSLVTVPTIVNWFAVQNSPAYQQAPQWEKNMFWILPTMGGVTPKIPKPFLLGYVFGSGVEHILNALFGKEDPATGFDGSEDTKKSGDFLSNIFESVVPNLLPAAVRPIAEQITNHSFFRNAPLVPDSAMKLLPEYRYSDYTTELTKQMGHMLGQVPYVNETSVASPLVIDNYVREWTGASGSLVLTLADKALRKAGVLPDPVKPTDTLADIPVVKAFVVRYPSAQAESIEAFRDEFQRRELYFNTVQTLAKGGNLAAVKIAQDHRAEMNTMAGIDKALGNASRAVHLINQNPDMQPDEKRQLIDSTYLSMIQMAQAGNAGFRASDGAVRASASSLAH